MARSEFEDAYEADEERIRGAILSEPISRLVAREPILVPPSASVREAVRIMNERRTGCVCVVEGERLAGIFTERDLLRLARDPVDLGSMPLCKVMTPDPETLHPDDGIALALYHMTEGGYRHIPLVDADQRPVGIVAMRDIVRFIVSMFPDTVLNVAPTRAAIQKQDGG